MKVLVCGGRDYADTVAVIRALAWVKDNFGMDLLIHGAARGADSLAGAAANTLGVPVAEYPANWARDGLSAGPRRNELMLRQRPDMVLWFPGGNGTAHMVRIARREGVPTVAGASSTLPVANQPHPNPK